MLIHQVQHISIYIARPPGEVYDFASNPENLPRWAAGLTSSAVHRDGDAWLLDSPFGQVKLRFVEKNGLGVMDHDIELDSGEVMHNPMRVVARGDGSELIFTLFRQPGMSDRQFSADKSAVEDDLAKLKELLETCS